MFKKILIANRGEIACRVMRTASSMGIETVAVYSEADADARHVGMATEAVLIGPPPAAESYLSIDKILAAIEQTGAEAVHPGYGFLSENADFATALDERGVAFIGPPPPAIAAMGDKIESKKIALAAGVNTVPGSDGEVGDPDEAVRVAGDIGYPVMLKASAGGGGKGMRIAHDESEVHEGFRLAQSEARSSFGDDRLFVEKYIEEPRHIEIQIMADGHGNVVHLNERECSIQRRHQKVIEEAPSPFVDADMRAAMGAQAIELAKAVGYQSAGTVEFIAGADKSFYFLEMNTRLQVEHPVTELITGLDLVELMIRVAAGEALPLAQSDIGIEGWAMESRIYAEDATRGFLPSIGRLTRYLPPAETSNVRVDSGVEEGGEVSVYYDPMIAKLITYGATRDAACDHMRAALDSFTIHGVEHNIGFLSSVLARQRFADGRLTTHFIDQEFPDGYDGRLGADDNDSVLLAAGVFMSLRQLERDAKISGRSDGGRFTVGADWMVSIDDREHQVRAEPVDDGYKIAGADGRDLTVTSDWALGMPVFAAMVDDRSIHVQVARLRDGYRLSHDGARVNVTVRSARAAELAARMPKKEPPDLSRFLLSPMPGMVVSIAVGEGDTVKAGEELCVVDAMKMENVLRAERDATVAKVLVGKGDSLNVDQVILEFA